MLKYAIMINDKTKQCNVGLGTNETFYQKIGMLLTDVEQARDNNWYVKGYAPNGETAQDSSDGTADETAGEGVVCAADEDTDEDADVNNGETCDSMPVDTVV